jgi:hypothetical protein
MMMMMIKPSPRLVLLWAYSVMQIPHEQFFDSLNPSEGLARRQKSTHKQVDLLAFKGNLGWIKTTKRDERPGGQLIIFPTTVPPTVLPTVDIPYNCNSYYYYYYYYY